MSGVKRIPATFSSAPDFFRKDLYSHILEVSSKYQNLQIVGLKGIGKSLALRLLEFNQDRIKKNLNLKFDSLVYLTDLSLLSDNTTSSVLKLIFSKLLGFEKTHHLDGGDLSYEIQKYFDKIKQEGKRVIIIFDSWDRIGLATNSEVSQFLHALYKQNMDFMSYVFSVDYQIDSKKAMDTYGELGRLMLNNISYLTPFDLRESDWFFDSLVKNIPELKYSGKDKAKILSVSGGYAVIIKRLFEVLVSGSSLDEAIENPRKLSGLSYSFDIMLGPLKSEFEVLKKLANGIETDDVESMQKLKNYFLIDSKNRFINKVLQNYLKEDSTKNGDFEENIGDVRLKSNLTSSEYKIFSYLLSKRGMVCSREEIINEVWGEKATRGISDHALDQIVSRLRKKLTDSSENLLIETLRGRGHRLI